jgi:hypothetical protein
MKTIVEIPDDKLDQLFKNSSNQLYHEFDRGDWNRLTNLLEMHEKITTDGSILLRKNNAIKG